ncbi:MAG: FliH/SctL family protein [Candidatus Methylomirabilia bacterium]
MYEPAFVPSRAPGRAIRPAILPELSRPSPSSTEIEGHDAQAKEESLTVIREAHRMARAIIARAKTHARELEAEARERAYQAGMERALETEGEALRQAAHALSAATERLATGLGEAERALTETLPRLALRLAQAILQAELTLNPEALTGVVRTAIRAVLPARHIVVTLHPDDRATLDRARARLGELLAESELKLETRDSLERGHVLIETEALILDASVDRQLQEAVRLLQEPA